MLLAPLNVKAIGEKENNLPIFLLQLFHQWIVDLRVHWRKDALFRDRTIKDLFDSYKP